MSTTKKTTGTPNVIVFGETGSGKSSLVNLVKGINVAETSSKAKGCTFESTPYNVIIHNSNYNLFDTAGLNEWEGGKVSAKEAVVNLYKLICDLEDGVSLLVYCVRGPRIKDTTVKNYKLFYEALCQEQVPIVVAVTGLENEEPTMDSWWTQNKQTFKDAGMTFEGHACITATKGKGNVFEEEYKESAEKVKKLMKRSSRNKPWKMERNSWLVKAVARVWNFFARTFDLPRFSLSKVLSSALQFVGVPKDEADDIANRVELE
jgi:predicted GTPase